MWSKMEYKVFIWMCVLIAAVQAVEVTMNKKWTPNFGWLITCSWRLYNNDSLQSVRLFEDDRQFMIYRPEVNGAEHSVEYRRAEDFMAVNCTESELRGLTGACILTMELLQPQTKNFTYSCEVSGERPKFLMDKKRLHVDALVPPTDAILKEESRNEESGRVMLNCTSSGVPAPRLVWTVDGQKVPADFTGSMSNSSSKVWHVWSAMSYTASNEHTVICTPEITWASETITGEPATYNSADIVKGNVWNPESLSTLLKIAEAKSRKLGVH